MSGEARSSEFLLSTATVMIGPSAKVFELDPATHSIGLVKNVMASADVAYTELGQGINNQVVMSVQTKLDTKISAEVYEFTAKNLGYASGIDAGSVVENTVSFTLSSAVTAGGATVALTLATGILAGDFIAIQDLTQGDRVHIGKVASVASNTVTLAAGYTIPVTQTFTVAGTVVYKVNIINVGVNNFQPTFGAKLVGTLPGTGKPVTLIFPKVKVTKGISMSFVTENFSNMPFELTPYQLTPTDPYYADFGNQTWKIFK